MNQMTKINLREAIQKLRDGPSYCVKCGKEQKKVVFNDKTTGWVCSDIFEHLGYEDPEELRRLRAEEDEL